METIYKTPGQLIDSLLAKKGWTQRVLAIVLGMGETGIARLVSDNRPVDAAISLKLEDVFGVPAERFLELKRSYDLAKARITTSPDPGRATRAQLFGELPITEMIKRGWLDASNIRNVSEVEAALVKFFGVASPEDIQILPHAAKKTSPEGSLTLAQMAWLYRVKQIASGMIVPRYSPNAVREAVKKLDGVLAPAEEARKVPRILAE